MDVKLTQKQKRFAEYYAASGNATESAIKAGYSKKTAKTTGAENMTKQYIVDYIKELNKEGDSKRIADMQEVKELWTSIIRGENEEAQLKDILKASELMAKTNGAFLDKVEHKGTVDINNPFSKLTTEELRRLVNK